ncbi:hypothetical protein KNP414_01902 [Paenibacillus mucilaginosus KNP414]|uniref:Uncharacterized protein n=1 Tax=Paenibacillus mucilaginosus (strain KNP414) TaxID=1036673 RepID=F8FR26_PAEMK|nr:hypothetical protein KNP414_01902 [Paenibacillus mucilaginosus KNP414]
MARDIHTKGRAAAAARPFAYSESWGSGTYSHLALPVWNPFLCLIDLHIK